MIAFYGIYFMVESHKCTGFTYVQLPSNMAARRAKAYASTSEAVTYHHQSLKHDLKQSFGSFWQMGPDMIFDFRRFPGVNALNTIHYSFKIFLRFWLAQSTRMIHLIKFSASYNAFLVF